MVANSRIRTSSSNYGHTEHGKGVPNVTNQKADIFTGAKQGNLQSNDRQHLQRLDKFHAE